MGTAGLEVFAYFNNDGGRHAVRNAAALAALVDQHRQHLVA